MGMFEIRVTDYNGIDVIRADNSGRGVFDIFSSINGRYIGTIDRHQGTVTAKGNSYVATDIKSGWGVKEFTIVRNGSHPVIYKTLGHVAVDQREYQPLALLIYTMEEHWHFAPSGPSYSGPNFIGGGYN
ncbi:unnamed protein product [Adineta steineri]|uniref:Uncharacterized protein n=1 Tax=Adineta steineri TaxID=433720 RepID=A0A815LZE1_9BILA|nr:unnamed protein product [Adineta steineri]CAF1619660.1 unnamed protein product [Adineta steineri]